MHTRLVAPASANYGRYFSVKCRPAAIYEIVYLSTRLVAIERSKLHLSAERDVDV